ncbi:MAG: hypothetical protein JWR73_2984 [Tardiphaga sp.]|nr:hypothetical protein [Tardiphaga sp.]
MRRLLSGLQSVVVRGLAVSSLAVLIALGASGVGVAQQDQAKQPAGNQTPSPADVARESQRKSDEFVEAAQAINGPGGNPECVWLGRRVVVLMWRDDLDTAFRHLDLYDRFGCPGGHVQATFRCLVKFGAIDPKQPDSLNSRVHACWINPGAQPQQAAAPGQPTNPAAPPTPPQPAAATPTPTEQK